MSTVLYYILIHCSGNVYGMNHFRGGQNYNLKSFLLEMYLYREPRWIIQIETADHQYPSQKLASVAAQSSRRVCKLTNFRWSKGEDARL